MKKLLTLVLFTLSFVCNAQSVIENKPLGSGNATVGKSQAIEVYHGLYFVPQHMPGYPTSAVIWPRVIETDCDLFSTTLHCNGYNDKSGKGRAEYLFYTAREKSKFELDFPALVDRVNLISARQKDMVKKLDNRSTIIIYKEVPYKDQGE